MSSKPGKRVLIENSMGPRGLGPNNGPLLHKHSMEDEAFYVLEGDFSFPYGNSKNKHAGKGQFRYVPKE